MSQADVTLVKIKMYLLELEEKGSEIYHPVLAGLWRIINEASQEDLFRPRNGNGANHTGE